MRSGFQKLTIVTKRKIPKQSSRPIQSTHKLWSVIFINHIIGFLCRIVLRQDHDLKSRYNVTLQWARLIHTDIYHFSHIFRVLLQIKWFWCELNMQINRDGEPMRSKKFTFKVLPQRLSVHVADTELFSKSRGLESPRAPQRKQVSRKIDARQLKREQHPVKRVASHPIARTVLKSSVILGIGIGIGAKMQQRRLLFK